MKAFILKLIFLLILVNVNSKSIYEINKTNETEYLVKIFTSCLLNIDKVASNIPLTGRQIQDLLNIIDSDILLIKEANNDLSRDISRILIEMIKKAMKQRALLFQQKNPITSYNFNLS